VDEHRAALKAAPGRDGRAVRTAALLAPPAAFAGLFFVVPFASILGRGLGDGVPWHALVGAETRSLLAFTLWQAAASTALTLVAGLPLAWVLGTFRFRGRSLLRALVLVPFVLPTVVVAAGFVALLPTAAERGIGPVLAAHVFFNIAVVVRVVGGAWAAQSPTAWEAAAVLGAGPVRRLREVTLPLLAPAIGAAAALTFLFCFTSFGVVLVLGGPTRTTLETEIYNQAARAFDLRTAAALSIVQLVAVGLVLAAGAWLERRSAAARDLSREADVLRRPSRREALSAVAAVILTLAFLAAPIVMLVARSLDTPAGTGLAFYRALGRETTALLVPPWETAVWSLAFAAAATAIALVLGSLASLALARIRPTTLDAAVLLPLGASAVMLGFGFVIAFDDPPLDIRGAWWLVPVAQALVAVPFVIRILVPALRSIEPRLHEAAATLGASPRRTLREIDLPLAARALAGAAGFAFAVALGEFGATVFVARAEHPTLPVAIFRFLGRPGAENQGTAAALAVVLAALTVAVALGAELLATDRRRTA
jgi:thiamine transport system permease protein